MRATLLFFAYCFLCFVLAAFVASALLATGWIELEPHRVMSRLAQIFILLGIWPLLRLLQLADRASLGYGVSGPALRRAVGWGWVQGVAILLALVLALLALEIRVPDPNLADWSTILGNVAQALIGGLLIGVLEETFFRGALYTAIRRRDGLASALIWSSLLYALLHFMKPGALPEGMAFDGSGSLWMFVQVFVDVFQWKHLDSLVALFLVGLFLALVRERTGHIGWCIGLHAGWVFVIQTTRRVTDGNESSGLAFLVGGYDGTIGWLAALWIGLLALGYGALTRQGERR
ncbi:CPBP family intramembrane glutamic endopeptidase [Thiobaca trueperi]|uniref:CAAX prenyl protease 2/Lysostaphin resistance protein A-like domain-containing protein n=1 Tax=Thiobaca trueperi TaxID=127458 RepID=A0A4V2V1P7_9GAMM|nr:CPBP family intramembrane glutamic endopeptidase [Thiobaca trueperi]TCT21992.1 hypothetical protein EDC35_10390 [Thiobaca trueperi]